MRVWNIQPVHMQVGPILAVICELNHDMQMHNHASAAIYPAKCPPQMTRRNPGWLPNQAGAQSADTLETRWDRRHGIVASVCVRVVARTAHHLPRLRDTGRPDSPRGRSF